MTTLASLALAKGSIIVYVDDGDKIDVKYAVKLDKTQATYMTHTGSIPDSLANGVGALTGVISGEVNLAVTASTESINGSTVQVVDSSTGAVKNVKVDDDTVIIGINAKDKESAATDEALPATKTPSDTTKYYANCFYIGSDNSLGTGDTLKLIVYCDDLLDVMP